MKRAIVFCCIGLILITCSLHAQQELSAEQRAWVEGAEKCEDAGWVYLRIGGAPFARGFQHGYLLADRIKDAVDMTAAYCENTTSRDWEFYRKAAEDIFLPKLDSEYRAEMEGIVAGVGAAGVEGPDLPALTAYNGMLELTWYYVPWLDRTEQGGEPVGSALDKCSAFIATGNATFDGRIVVAHNSWVDYIIGARWNVALDVTPENGHRFITQAMPGWIFGGTDFWINSEGLVVSETTILGTIGFDTEGVPTFQRIRKAVQYADSIDSFVEILKAGNNGGYANDWLVGDIKTGEIACLELTLEHPKLMRTFDGYFAGSNLAVDREVRAKDTVWDYDDMTLANHTRWVRWQQLMRQYYGKIDVELAKRFISDHYDTYRERYSLFGGTLCCHYGLIGGGLGTTDGKATDSDLIYQMVFHARLGHPCGVPFIGAQMLEKNDKLGWQEPYVLDLPTRPWIAIKARGFREPESN